MVSPFVWGDAGGRMTPDQIAAQRKVADAMMREGMDYSPVGHWTQGLARVSQALMGGYEGYRADQAEKANRTADAEILRSLFPQAASAPAAPASFAAPKPADATVALGSSRAVDDPASTLAPSRPVQLASLGDPAAAISSIESGGAYDKLGPVTRTGDRAYGKYQVMGANIPVWTKAHLGQEMTPEQFLANPQAQDAVFKGQFGQYSQKYGPEGAARAWFAGEGGMNDMSRRDQLGTTVQAYADKFNRGMGTPQSAAVPPGAVPAAAPAAQSGANPALIAAIASPYASEGTKKIAAILLHQQMQGDAVTTVDLGNEVGIMDKRGNLIRRMPKGEPNKGPEYGVIDKDEFGNERYGWRDPRTKTTTRTSEVAPAASSTIPPAPAGVDPKLWREGYSRNVLSDALPPDPKNVSALRKEVQDLPSYKNLAQAAPVYKSMVEAAGRDTRAADVNLIYGLAKIMDPGSVVRESEMTVAQAVATLPQQLRANIESQLTATGRLSPETREAIMQEAFGRMGSYNVMFGQDAEMYRGIAKRGRMNEADVLPNFGEFKPWVRSPGPKSADDYAKQYGNK